PAHLGPRGLAALGLPPAGQEAVLRRHLFPARRPAGPPGLLLGPQTAGCGVAREARGPRERRRRDRQRGGRGVRPRRPRRTGASLAPEPRPPRRRPFAPLRPRSRRLRRWPQVSA